MNRREVRKDVLSEVYNRLDEGVCDVCEHRSEDDKCFKYCKRNDDFIDYELDAFKKWLANEIKQLGDINND